MAILSIVSPITKLSLKAFVFKSIFVFLVFSLVLTGPLRAAPVRVCSTLADGSFESEPNLLREVLTLPAQTSSKVSSRELLRRLLTRYYISQTLQDRLAPDLLDVERDLDLAIPPVGLEYLMPSDFGRAHNFPRLAPLAGVRTDVHFKWREEKSEIALEDNDLPLSGEEKVPFLSNLKVNCKIEYKFKDHGLSTKFYSLYVARRIEDMTYYEITGIEGLEIYHKSVRGKRGKVVARTIVIKYQDRTIRKRLTPGDERDVTKTIQAALFENFNIGKRIKFKSQFVRNRFAIPIAIKTDVASDEFNVIGKLTLDEVVDENYLDGSGAREVTVEWFRSSKVKMKEFLKDLRNFLNTQT